MFHKSLEVHQEAAVDKIFFIKNQWVMKQAKIHVGEKGYTREKQIHKGLNSIFLTCISYNSVAWKQHEPIPTTEIEIFILIEKNW